MSIRTALAVVLLGACAMVPASASAQGSTGELREEVYRHRIAGEIGFYHRSDVFGNVLAIQPGVHAAIGLVDPVTSDVSAQLDIDWRGAGFSIESTRGASNAAFRVFSPFVGVRIGFGGGEPGGRWRVRFGGGVTLPLANAYSADFDLFAARSFGLAMTGAWDPWLNSLATMAVVARGDVEYRHTYFFAGAEAAFGAMLPLEWEGSTGNTVLVPQLGVFAAGRPIEQLAIGLRFHAVGAFPVGDGTPRPAGYTALSPFVRGEFGAGFLEVRWLLNLDEPFGPALDDGGFWGVYVVGGAQF